MMQHAAGTTSHTFVVEDKWSTVSKELEVPPAIYKKWWIIIRDNYQEKGRHYHTLEHIHFMLECCDKFRFKLYSVQEVVLAIFFHEYEN